MKYCRYCDQWLEESCFTVRRASSDGLGYKCRSCSSAYSKKAYNNLIVKSFALHRARIWRETNRQKRREIVNRSYLKHRKKKLEGSKSYNRRVRLENLVKARLYGRIAAAKRRSRCEGAGELDGNVIRMILGMARGACIYCREAKPLTLDHFDPLAAGGKNEWHNIVPSCKSCNCSKGAKDGADWIHERCGVSGVVDVLVFMKSVRKATKRLFAGIWLDEQERTEELLSTAE